MYSEQQIHTLRLNRQGRIQPSWSPAWLTVFAIASWFGVLVAIRPDGIGTDTANYRSHFLRLLAEDDYTTRFEPAFDLMMRMVASVTHAPEILFGLIYALLLALLIAGMRNATWSVPRSKMSMFPLAALGLLLFSSWFITGSTNGLRQGLSLGMFYFGVTLILFRKKWLPGLLFVCTAPFFHLSTILLWPIIFAALLLPMWTITLLFLFSGAAYTVGLLEQIVFLMSEMTEVNAYGWVIDYADHVSRWEGWQADLFAYTVGMAIIHLIGRAFVPKHDRAPIDAALKIYMLACIPYFVFGFGNFSNRYGTMAWTFLPILHITWIFTARINAKFRTAITLLLLVGGVTRYSLYLTGIL